ncbi:unnamed protein product [Zymoseptoria tritici ST99CH_1E4]|uniref:Uncharacterized protein n=1 Tax=Zymoseptoria tritici ST99CH_1E4 TaxID=1276532 RepID=A0A2H1H9S4_ZYMTR|nr:unnamed protein product [Zymoseptoria tritici ST99CH_1E4]
MVREGMNMSEKIKINSIATSPLSRLLEDASEQGPDSSSTTSSSTEVSCQSGTSTTEINHNVAREVHAVLVRDRQRGEHIITGFGKRSDGREAHVVLA